MSHYLPVEEIEKELREAAEEFQRASKELEQEQDLLESDMVQALERQKIDELKKRLSV